MQLIIKIIQLDIQFDELYTYFIPVVYNYYYIREGPLKNFSMVGMFFCLASGARIFLFLYVF